MTFKKQKISPHKQQILSDFSTHVSSGKAAFFERYRMQFIAGHRQGCWLHDIDGHKDLFNLHCNGGVFNLGHRHPDIVRTLQDASQTLDIGNHHLISEARSRLASALTSTMPEPLNKVMFGVSGGEAVDFALKLACGFTGRRNVVSVTGGYHGHTGLAVQTGDAQYQSPFNIHPQHFQQVPFNNLEAMKSAITGDTAAVILETVPATLGMLMPSPNYLSNIRQWCDEHGALLILDEIQTGWGRTGKLWGFKHFNVVPDMVVLGKGMSGGVYPMSATVFTDTLGDYLHDHPFAHISTFGGSELGCAVAEKVLSMSKDSEFLAHVNRLAERFADGLNAIKQKPFVGFQQLGLMMAIETDSELAGQVLTKTAYDQGLLMIYANNRPNAVQFLPPLIMDEADIPMILEKLKAALKQARRITPLITLKEKWSRRDE